MGATAGVLRDIPFNEDLGAPPYQRGEDAFFHVQLTARGARIHGVRSSVIEHRFYPHRLTRPRLMALASNMGRCEAYIWPHWWPAELGLRRARSLAYRILLSGYRLAVHTDVPDREMKLVAKVEFHRELRRLRGRPRKFERHG